MEINNIYISIAKKMKLQSSLLEQIFTLKEKILQQLNIYAYAICLYVYCLVKGKIKCNMGTIHAFWHFVCRS